MKEVTKAIIVAAGLGSRMYPFTKEESKLMLPIINKPIIEYLIEELTASGIKEVIIVSNHIEEIKKFFSEDPYLIDLLKKLKKEDIIKKLHHIETLSKIDLIEQKVPMGWMHEVLHSKKFIKDEPFIVCFSDVLYYSNVPPSKQLINAYYKTRKNIKAEARFLLKPIVLDLAKKEKYKMGEDLVDLDVFDKLREKNDLHNINIEGDFHNIGDPLSYLKTQTFFGLKDKNIKKEYKDYLISITNSR